MNIARDALKLLNPSGLISHPSGLRPLGWNESRGICNFNASLPMFVQYYISMNPKWTSCFLLVSLSSISSLYYSTFEYHTFKTQFDNGSSLQLYFWKLLFGENPFKNFSFIIQQLIHLIKNYLLSKNCNLTTVPKLQQWGAQ